MKLRLRTEIEKARAGARRRRAKSARGSTPRSPSSRSRASARSTPSAPTLLRERPVEARVDPLFEVAAEDERSGSSARRFERWFQERARRAAGGRAPHPAAARARARRAGPARALATGGRRARRAARLRRRPGGAIPSIARPLDAIVERLERARRITCSRPTPKTTTSRKNLAHESTVRRRARAREEAVRAGRRATRRARGRAARARRGQDRQELELEGERARFPQAPAMRARRARAARRAARGARAPARRARRRSRGLSARRARARSSTAYEELKARAGKLDFLDLLLLTRDLLRDDARVRASCRSASRTSSSTSSRTPIRCRPRSCCCSPADDPAESDPDARAPGARQAVRRRRSEAVDLPLPPRRRRALRGHQAPARRRAAPRSFT